MVIWNTSSGRRRSRKSAARSSRLARVPESLTPRSLRLEPFEERLLLSVNGPSLVAIIPSEGAVINPNQVVRVRRGS